MKSQPAGGAIQRVTLYKSMRHECLYKIMFVHLQRSRCWDVWMERRKVGTLSHCRPESRGWLHLFLERASVALPQITGSMLRSHTWPRGAAPWMAAPLMCMTWIHFMALYVYDNAECFVGCTRWWIRGLSVGWRENRVNVYANDRCQRTYILRL